jgi:hypothetical protein
MVVREFFFFRFSLLLFFGVDKLFQSFCHRDLPILRFLNLQKIWRNNFYLDMLRDLMLSAPPKKLLEGRLSSFIFGIHREVNHNLHPAAVMNAHDSSPTKTRLWRFRSGSA